MGKCLDVGQFMHEANSMANIGGYLVEIRNVLCLMHISHDNKQLTLDKVSESY